MSRASVVRNTMNKYIAENPCTVIAYERPLVDNGYDVDIPDITQAAVKNTLGIGRVSRRSLPDPYVSSARTPYDFKDVFYLLAPYNATWLKKGIVFVYGDNKFKTRYPEKRYMFGEVTYMLCGLEQVTSGNIGDYSGQ